MDKGKIKFDEWQRYADEDELAAKAILKEGGPANPICFHAQQIAEKYLKGFIVLSDGRFEKRHQLDYLLQLCIKIDPTFKELVEEVTYLTDYYTETRYPGEIYDFTLGECKKALQKALEIKRFVLGKMK